MNREQALALADSYEASALYIETYGWHRGSLFLGFDQSRDGGFTTWGDAIVDANYPPVCAVGAGYAVRGMGTTETEIGLWSKPLLDVIRESARQCGLTWMFTSVSQWNDTYGRSGEEVVELFRRTARRIRAGFIGEEPREIEFEPMPETEPIKEPSPSPSPATTPEKEPVPA